MVQRCHWVPFVLAPYCWSWGQPLRVVCTPGKTLLEKNNFLPTSGFQLQTAYELKTGACVSLCHSTGAPSGAGPCRPCACCQSLWIQMCISPEAFRRSCLLSVLHCFWLWHFLCHCFCKVPSAEGKMFDGHIPFRAACSKVPHSGNIVWLWVLVFVPIYCRSKLLWQYWARHWLTNPCLPNQWQNDSTFKHTAKKVHSSC